MSEKILTFIKQNKVHVIIWTLGLLVFGYYIYNVVTTPTYLLCGIMLNTETTETDTKAEDLAKDFATAYDIELARGDVAFLDNYKCSVNEKELSEESVEAVQQILIHQGKGILDFVSGPTDVMKKLAYETYVDDSYVFANLTEVLSAEQAKFYKPYFLYIDLDVVEKINDAYDKKEDTSKIKLPDPTKPEKMENPVPVLIDISNVSKLKEVYGENLSELTFGLVEGSPNQSIALNFLEYIMFEEE